MPEKHVKKSSTCLVIREIQIKTTLRFHLISVRMDNIKKYNHKIKIIYSGSITEDNIYDLILNDVIMDAVAMNPTPTHNGQRLRIYYATQVSTQPPTFVVFVNDPELLHFSYKRYLENCMRQAFGFEGTPIHIIARNRD